MGEIILESISEDPIFFIKVVERFVLPPLYKLVFDKKPIV